VYWASWGVCWVNPSLVAVACFFPGRAKDLSASPHTRNINAPVKQVTSHIQCCFEANAAQCRYKRPWNIGWPVPAASVPAKHNYMYIQTLSSSTHCLPCVPAVWTSSTICNWGHIKSWGIRPEEATAHQPAVSSSVPRKPKVSTVTALSIGNRTEMTRFKTSFREEHSAVTGEQPQEAPNYGDWTRRGAHWRTGPVQTCCQKPWGQ